MQHAACYKKGYPRPRFVRESYVCLNGEWNFMFDDENVGEKHKYYNDFSGFEKSVKINVPFAYQSEASGVDDKTDHSYMWYSRRFDYSLARGKRLIINCDVEIICKDREQESFDTMLIRKQALQRLKKIYDNYNLRYVHKYNYNYWLNVEEELIRCCLNYTYLDKLLEQLLLLSRMDTESRTIQIIQPLVQINMEWKGVNQTMQDTIERAKKVGYYIGKTIKEKNGENKVKSYKNKLINATVSHDRERVLEIMLQLSGYTDGEISTIYDILDNPDNWSDIAISFTNAMIPYTKKEKEEN